MKQIVNDLENVENKEDVKVLEEDLLEDLSIFNGNLQDIVEKKNNIWLGVSISLKPYSDKLAKQYLKLIIKYSKDKALVFIGDEPAAINHRVLEGYGWETSLKKAIKKGDLYVKRYSKLIKELSPEEQRKIKIVRWRDVWSWKLEKIYEIIKKEYLSNSDFRKEVESPIIIYLVNSKRTIKSSRIAKMSEYILRELPFLLEGVEYGGVSYKTLLYPTYGKTSLSEVVTKIQKGERFVELKRKLCLEGNHILADSPILNNNESDILESI